MSRHTAASDLLGVALSPGTVVAAGAGISTIWSGELELNGGANGSREALAQALTDAARASGLVSPGIVVALLPPLAETRTIALPPLRDDDRNLFLSRNAAKYFVGARGAQVVGSQAGLAGTKGAPTTSVLASATAQQLMQTVQEASVAAGCGVRAVIPAESAWAAAAAALWPALARGTAYAIVAHDERSDLLTLFNGSLVAVRRFRGPTDAGQIAGIVSDGAGGAARVAVLGTPGAARDLADALMAAGIRVLLPEPKWAELSERPDALAARFAGAATGLRIRSPASRAEERASVRRAAWWTFGTAAAVLALAALVHYAGVQRELSSVRAQRAAIRAQVDASLAGRSSVEATYGQLAALAGTARGATRWSAVLASLASHLPLDASLTAFRARGDSIFIDGVAERAAPVFDEIGRMPGVTGVRATAPVRRDAIEGEVPLEHFSLGARIAGGRR